MGVKSGVAILFIHNCDIKFEIISNLLNSDEEIIKQNEKKSLIWNISNKYYKKNVDVILFDDSVSLMNFNKNNDKEVSIEILIILIDGVKDWKSEFCNADFVNIISKYETKIVIDFNPVSKHADDPIDEDLIKYLVEHCIEWVSLYKNPSDDDDLSESSKTEELLFNGLIRVKDAVYSHNWAGTEINCSTQPDDTIFTKKDPETDPFVSMIGSLEKIRTECSKLNIEERQEYAAKVSMEFLKNILTFNESD